MEDKQEPSEREILLYLHLETSHFPPVFDLSLSQPFEIFLEIKRDIVKNEGRRPLTFSTAGSIFDGAYAISSGLIQLIDREDDTVIDLHNIDQTNWPSKAVGSITPSLIDSFITVAPRSRISPSLKVVQKRFDHELPLGLPINIKDYLKAGHNYRLQLTVRDLNIQWWAWGSVSELGINSTTTIETLPPHAAGKIVASGLPHRDFRVVESFPNPPTLKIKLLPVPPPPRAPNIIAATSDDQQDEGKGKQKMQPQAPNSQPRVSVTITNTGSQVITVKSALRQLYICPIDDHHLHGRIQDCDRITSTHRAPSIKNFSIIDSSTFGELSPTWISPSGLPSGHSSPQNFTTLKPGVPVSNVVDLPERHAKMMQGKRCVLSLRPSEVAWVEGDIEELFRGADERGERGLWMVFQRSLRPPLILECEDQLVYELPAPLMEN